MIYKNKYLKYKNKYLKLKNILNGGNNDDQNNLNINVDNVNRPDGNNVIITNNNNETKLCDGSANCNKYVYVRSTENQAGLYKRDGGDIRFNVHCGSSNASTSLKNTNGLGEIQNGDKSRIRLSDNETRICTNDNCDGFYVSRGPQRAGINNSIYMDASNGADPLIRFGEWLIQKQHGQMRIINSNENGADKNTNAIKASWASSDRNI